jgi:L-2-hydroxycarboxylate dehydrogenase (NAD+)
LPGQLEAAWAEKVETAGGLLFTEAEIQAFNKIAATCGVQKLTF